MHRRERATKWTAPPNWGIAFSMAELVLAQRPDRYLRSPRLTAGATPVLHAIAWDGEDGEAHLTFDVELAPLGVAEPVARERRADVLDLTVSDAPGISGDPLDEDRAWHGREQVSVERQGGVSTVILARGEQRIEVWKAWATASAPALLPVAHGTWVAFHHNLREDDGTADLTKWIALFFVDATGSVHEPSAPMTDRDRDREGEEQGFELPSLAVGPDGAVAVFGRGSHRFWRQDFTASGTSARVPLGDGDWGCRGRRVAALVAHEVLLTARRERRGIVIDTQPIPSGGPPALRPVAPPRSVARPARLRPSSPDPAARWGRRTLFGDIHQHSAHSDGCGTAHEPYLRARHVYGDDFAALSDHESFLGKRIGPGEWAYLQAVAEAHHAPGDGDDAFSTLFAYEWTGKAYPGPGHKVVYAERPGTRVVSRDREPTGQGLLAALRGTGSIAVPHHVGWTGADEAAHDPELQPIWEICSCHGCYLHEAHPLGGRGDLRDQMVEAVLRRGKRFGFIACSDGHGLLFHHGVGRKRDPFRTGLTAVQASTNDRGAILGALRERRSYATSGVPIYLDVDAGGRPMGSEVERGVPIVVRAAACSPIATVSLVGPDGVVARATGEGSEAVLHARLEHDWLYAKVEQRDGEMAWSSPVWASEKR